MTRCWSVAFTKFSASLIIYLLLSWTFFVYFKVGIFGKSKYSVIMEPPHTHTISKFDLLQSTILYIFSNCPSFLAIAVTKHWPKAAWREGLLMFTGFSWSSWTRKGPRDRTWSRDHRGMRLTDPPPLVCSITHLPRSGTAHSGLGSLLSISN